MGAPTRVHGTKPTTHTDSSQSQLAAAPGEPEGSAADGLVIRHRLPGRVRFYCPGIQGNSALAAGVEKTVRDLPGVTEASVSPATGTLLVCYNDCLRSFDAIVSGLQHSAPCRPPERGAVHRSSPFLTALAASLKNLAKRTDQVIRTVSGGHVDLQQVVTVGLFVRACLMAANSGVLSWAAAQGAAEFIIAWTLYQNPGAQEQLQQAKQVASPSP